jgi:hypothetical protein
MPYHEIDCQSNGCLFCAERAMNTAINRYANVAKVQVTYDESGEILRVKYSNGTTFETPRGEELPAQIRLLIAAINAAAEPLIAAAAAEAAQSQEVVVP